VAAQQKWSQNVFPLVMDLATYKGNVIAAPLGIHRINSVIYNRRLFMELGARPPETWADLEVLAAKFRASGIKPIAWSDEAWQIATVFESLLLAEVGPTAYLDMVVMRKRSAWQNPGVERALKRLRWLRGLNGDVPQERQWTASAREIMGNSAAMMIMGDWAYGELLAWGASPHSDVGCVPVPGTARMHLYSVDTLAMLKSDRQATHQQAKFAESVVAMTTQLAFNRVKGAVPVRRDLTLTVLNTLDACARDSWETFASPSAARDPSLAHRMAADEATIDAVAQTLWRYVTDPRADTRVTQRRLAAVVQAPSAGTP